MSRPTGPSAQRFYREQWDGSDAFITHYVYMQRNVRMCAISCCCCGDLLPEVEEEQSSEREDDNY